ncbi:hypothetical protein BDR05DRAFT_205932 [Suillus weaverae]|nr:hypothetical protein BDR05DRAFT_205932 [Suillus weaverae]
MSLLRTYAYRLLQYSPFIPPTPKTCLCIGCSRSSLLWRFKLITNPATEEGFAFSILLMIHLYPHSRSNWYQFSHAPIPPSPSSFESHTTQVPGQHGRQPRRALRSKDCHRGCLEMSSTMESIAPIPGPPRDQVTCTPVFLPMFSPRLSCARRCMIDF